MLSLVAVATDLAPDPSLAWILFVLLGVFFLAIIVGALVSRNSRQG